MKNIKVSDFEYESLKERVRVQMRKQNPTEREVSDLVGKFARE